MKYQRYQIETKKALHILFHPHRFLVKVKKWALFKLLIKELVHYRGNLKIVKNRPCVYGVFSGPIGGFAPRNKLCVGCLRCTTEYPEVVQIYHHPLHQQISGHIHYLMMEAETGSVPIRGAGYRGKFGGSSWDGMWTDLSEIVRPTRDGIHGREFISTEVYLKDSTVAIPIVFESNPQCNKILQRAAKELQTVVLEEPAFSFDDSTLLEQYRAGRRIFHLKAEKLEPEMIREVNRIFVDAKCREEVTLIGSGCVESAEVFIKAIICGLDLVAIKRAVAIVLQDQFKDEVWAVQRIKNFCAAWRDQLIEVMGAMGLRDVRRLRGEMGRAFFQKTLEEEAFKDIPGYARDN
ncbi:MAG: hypothetical protein P4L16_08405 [Chlamydiales bacterium]|nr:hypothetical protein [Chlamydiales bacterium]